MREAVIIARSEEGLPWTPIFYSSVGKWVALSCKQVFQVFQGFSFKLMAYSSLRLAQGGLNFRLSYKGSLC